MPRNIASVLDTVTPRGPAPTRLSEQLAGWAERRAVGYGLQRLAKLAGQVGRRAEVADGVRVFDGPAENSTLINLTGPIEGQSGISGGATIDILNRNSRRPEHIVRSVGACGTSTGVTYHYPPEPGSTISAPAAVLDVIVEANIRLTKVAQRHAS